MPEKIPNPDFLSRPQVFDRNGQFLRAFASRGRGDGELQNPYGVAVNSKGFVHVCDGWNNRIQVFTEEGVWVKSYGKKGSGEGQFSHPGGIAIGPDDSVVVADSGNSRVQVRAKLLSKSPGLASLCICSMRPWIPKTKTQCLEMTNLPRCPGAIKHRRVCSDVRHRGQRQWLLSDAFRHRSRRTWRDSGDGPRPQGHPGVQNKPQILNVYINIYLNAQAKFQAL